VATYGRTYCIQLEMRGKAQPDSPVLLLLEPPGEYD